jgi:WD40 repeat protein
MWIWDVAEGIPIAGPLVGHNSAVRKIRFSKDGKKFCSLDAENRVIVWDATYYHTIGVPVQLSPKAEDVALCGNKVVDRHEGASICVWDVAAGSLEKEYVETEYVTLQGAYFTTEDRIVNTMTGEDVTSKYTGGRLMGRVIFSRDDTRVLIKTFLPSNRLKIHCMLYDVDSGNIIADIGIGDASF